MRKASAIGGYQRLYKGILTLENHRECEDFMQDLCTPKELLELSKRLAAAEQIDAGVPYRQIAKEIGLSTATVSRVAFWYKNGHGGYKLVIGNLKR